MGKGGVRGKGETLRDPRGRGACGTDSTEFSTCLEPFVVCFARISLSSQLIAYILSTDQTPPEGEREREREDLANNGKNRQTERICSPRKLCGVHVKLGVL